MKRNATALVMAAGLFAATSAYAGTFVWSGGERGKWNNPLSYEGGTDGGNVPGASDEVWIPKSTTVNIDVTDADSFAVFANVYRIRPTNNTAVLVFDVPAGVTSVVNCAINTDSWAGGNSGWVVKKGLGGLELTSYTRFNNNGNSNYRDNYVNYCVEAGDLIMPQNTTTKHNGYYGNMVISNGANVVLEKAAANLEVHTYMQNLSGEGTIVDNYSGSASHTLRVQGRECESFAGTLTENVRWYGSGRTYLVGTNSTMTSAFQHYNNSSSASTMYSGVEGESSSYGVIGIKKFGKTGEPSSIGSNVQIGTRDFGCVIRYLGDGETTDKTLFVWDTVRAPVILDAGATGGLVWNGIWTQNTGKTANRSNHRLVLTGSNTVPCVFSGKLNSATFTSPETVQTNYDFYISKYGSGTWRFADNTNNAANRTFAGGIAVHEGTLQFDSLNERDVASALGTAANLHADATGPGTLAHVDYAYVLGGGAGVVTAALEHVGWDMPPTAANAATNRHIVLNGRGTLRANGSYLGLGGISGMTSGNHTLVLDGTTTVNNVASDISDGAGVVSVEKTGTGTWAIGRDLSFSGALDVKEGMLRVRPADRYTWYRWTIKASYSTANGGNEGMTIAQELGLFDANGMRQNLGLTMNSNIATLAIGQIGLDTEYNYWTREVVSEQGVVTNWRQLDCLCDDAKTDPGWTIQPYNSKTASSGSYPPRLDKTNSWLKVVLRLPYDASPVTSWDWAYSVNSSRSIVPRVPMYYTLEGSVDGLHWDELANHDTFVEIPESPLNAWRFGNQRNSDGTVGTSEFIAGKAPLGHDRGEAIASAPANAATWATLDNITSISVAAGASLVADGGAISLPSGITLTLDASSGGGEISGFVLPADGTVNLVNANSGAGTMTIPLALDGTDFSAASSWSVTMNGNPTSRRVAFAASGLTVRRPGTVFVMR